MAATPWYARHGLKFRCTLCGECCRRPGTVHMTKSEGTTIAGRLEGPGATWESLLGELWVEDLDGSLKVDVPDDQACPLLGDDGQCVVHDVKPMQCATYPFWPEILQHKKEWKAERKYCEGIDAARADRYSAEEIADLLMDQARTRESLD